MQSDFQEKRNLFAVSIRKESRNNKIRQLRNQYFQVIPQKYTFEGYIKYLDLDKDPLFTAQNVVQDPYILVRILLAKQENFIRITFKTSSTPSMIDEKLLPPQNSQFELEEVTLPKQYPFALQGALIQSITSDIEQDPQKYQKMPKQMQSKLIDLLLQYIKRNTYVETAKQPDYHTVLINFMEFFVSYIDSPDLRDQIIRWVSGTDGLKLIAHCLPGTFMRYTKYFRLYNLILKGLRHNKMHVRFEAIHVLLKSIQGSDFDDILSLLDKIPQVYKELINYFQKMDENDANQFFSDQPELYQSAREGGQCIVAFLDCYDDEIIKCMDEGAGYVGGWLIMQNDFHLIKIGLTILNCILGAEKQEGKMRGIEFLLESESVKNVQVWKRMFKSYEIVRHPRGEIRLLFITFVARVIANTELHYIKRMNSMVNFPQNESLVEMLIGMFIENDNIQIRYYILQCFQGICFYGDSVKYEISQHLHQQNANQINGYQTLSLDYLSNRMLNSEIINIMKQLQSSLNSQTSKDFIANTLAELINAFFEYLDIKPNAFLQ